MERRMVGHQAPIHNNGMVIGKVTVSVKDLASGLEGQKAFKVK